ncbi:MAG TPA: hypothetical protein VNQ74_08540, partial [Burkholderiaceae bacterium]|nr:hypothetical protein [Burkholderiaceae bacterium]
MEEALLCQMRELQNSQASAGSASNVAAVDLLGDQVRQFNERQNALEAQQLTSSQIASQLAAKVHELEAYVERSPIAVANAEVGALRAQMAGLLERIADVETNANRETIPIDNRLAQEQIVVAVREQNEALESAWQKKFDGLQQEVREKAALLRLRDGELTDVRLQLAAVVKRLDHVPPPPTAEASASAREAERALWQRDFEEQLAARLREMGDEIRGKLQGITTAQVDQEQFRGETLALTAGAATEAREAYHATVALRGEIAGLKAAFIEQQRAPDDGFVRSVEAKLREQMQELHGQIAEHQSATLEWQNQFKELPGDMQTLMQRQVQAETLAQQTQALVTQETAQIRGLVKADMAAIEAHSNELRAGDGALQAVEDKINGRLRELHNQIAHGMLALDRRDLELRELKTQLQALAQRIGHEDLPPLLVPMSADDLAEAGVAPPLGGFAVS